MLDPSLIRDHLDDVQTRMEHRGINLRPELDLLARLDAERREILPVLESARRARKEVGAQIARAKKEGQSAEEFLKVGQEYGAQIREQEAKLEQVEHERQALMLTLPNLPHESVPVGRTEADNQEVRRHLDPPTFNFEPKAHWDLGPALGILDFDRATKIARSRFAVLVGAGARLERALIDFMLDLHTGVHGYVEIAPPFLANANALTGTGNLPKFEAGSFQGDR